jgi:hypothetical protein
MSWFRGSDRRRFGTASRERKCSEQGHHSRRSCAGDYFFGPVSAPGAQPSTTGDEAYFVVLKGLSLGTHNFTATYSVNGHAGLPVHDITSGGHDATEQPGRAAGERQSGVKLNAERYHDDGTVTVSHGCRNVEDEPIKSGSNRGRNQCPKF